MAELEPDSLFIEELKKGHGWQLWVGQLLLKEGFIVEVPTLKVRPDQAEIDAYTDSGDIIVYVNGRKNRFECKSRKLAFNSIEDYPHPSAIVDRVNTWKRKQDRKPHAVILVSQITGKCIVVPVSTEENWTIEVKHDGVRDCDREYFLVEKNDLKSWDDLVSWLRGKKWVDRPRG